MSFCVGRMISFLVSPLVSSTDLGVEVGCYFGYADLMTLRFGTGLFVIDLLYPILFLLALDAAIAFFGFPTAVVDDFFYGGTILYTVPFDSGIL